MARVPYLSRDDLRAEDRQIFDDLVAERGTVLNLFRVLAHTPRLLRALLGYSSQIRFGLALDPALRELAILTVGRLLGARYEVAQHWNIARRAGVPRETLEALAEYERSPVFTDRERAVIRYSAEATRDVRVSEATFEALRSLLDTPRIVELVQLVAYYNMIARILEPLEVELEPGFTALP
jgi:uncharacterized peroxidase-related enzyme